jgi:hypothetical protein
MTKIEDALINRVSERIAFEHPQISFSEKKALLDIVVKLTDPIVYHVLGSERSAATVIDALANLISPEKRGEGAAERVKGASVKCQGGHNDNAIMG